MSYGLKNPVISSSGFTPLSEEEFHRLGRAVNNLWVILSIEEQLDLVMENYLDLENDLLSMATRIMVFTVPTYEYLAKERNLVVNRRLLNLLNSCRGYLGHTPHHLSSGIQGHDAQRASVYITDFKKFTTNEYDTFLGYRAMEAMRNYTQHAGFPLAVTWGRGRAGEDPESKIAYSAIPWIEDGWIRVSNQLGSAKSLKGAEVRWN
jgi:hypothetical protein